VSQTRYTAIPLSALLLFLGSTPVLAEPPPAVFGEIVDGATHKPIAGAWVVSAGEVTRTDSAGHFALSKKGATIGAHATGYARQQFPANSDTRQLALAPFHVRGLYLSHSGVGSMLLRNEVLDTAAKAELTAIVVDVKGDRGFISYPTHTAMAIQIGANHNVTMPDPAAFLADLHKRHLYAIARIVVFKDNPLARSHPDLAVENAQGSLFVDREGLAWTDPFNHTVWEYNINLAVETAALGFDEIQFDYVRCPDQKGVQFSKTNTEANRIETIVGFLSEAHKRLLPYNVSLSSDNFGYECWNTGDIGIGQCLADIGPVVDYMSPMLYPSSFQFGIPGLRHPLDDPYRIVFASLQKAKEHTGFAAAIFRPWLQAFNDYAFDRRKFGRVQIEQQIKGAQDAGASGWLLWDPRNQYSAADLAAIGRTLGWVAK